MSNNIEVEIRGRISKEKRDKLIDFFRKNGKFIREQNRVLLDYSTFLPGEGLKNREKDIRLRVTNKVPEIIIKVGRWDVQNEGRKEVSVKATVGEFDKLVEVYGLLGYKKAILAIRNSMLFEYKDIEWAIVEVPGHSYYWEGEKLVNSNENKNEVCEEIRKVSKELGLAEWTNDEFIDYMRELNEKVNEVFEYDNYQEGYFNKRFKLI